MRTNRLATTMALTTLTLLSCGSGTKAQPEASVQPEASTHEVSAQPEASVHEVSVQSEASAPPEPFELQGEWVYLGPSDVPHSLTISNQSMVYTDEEGQWSSSWTIKDYDNGLHRFEVVFQSGNGTYLPVGQNMSGTYVLSGNTLTVQLANGLGSYLAVQSPGSCTDGATLIPECRVYVKQN